MSRTLKTRAPALAALALAVALTAACAPTVEPAPTVESTAPVEPAPVVADEPTPEPDETTEPEPQPVPAAVIEEARAVAGEARHTDAEAQARGEELGALAQETYQASGRKLVFITSEGQYGWDGELERTFFTFTRFFPELQVAACRAGQPSTVEAAITAAQHCIDLQGDPSVYEIVNTVA